VRLVIELALELKVLGRWMRFLKWDLGMVGCFKLMQIGSSLQESAIYSPLSPCSPLLVGIEERLKDSKKFVGWCC
jgi:hypothetical protein